MKPEAVIFDIDGVLVDTRKSYLEAIRLTIELYLTKVLGLRNKGALLVSAKDVENFKMLGGFNNDWDCVEGLLFYLLSLLPARSRHVFFSRNTEISALPRTLRPRSLTSAKRHASGPAVIFKMLRKKKAVSRLLKSKNKAFLRHRDIGKWISYKKIVQIFQEVYLGGVLYKKVYKRRSRYWKKPGLYLKETPLLTGPFLKALRTRGLKLGVATGRNRFETLMVLDRFGWKKYFSSIVTADEIPPQFSKPHPYGLVRNSKQLKVRHFLYIGDLPDDMRAARAAARSGLSVEGIGFLKGVNEKSAMRRELLRAGAQAAVKDLEGLKSYLN